MEDEKRALKRLNELLNPTEPSNPYQLNWYCFEGTRPQRTVPAVIVGQQSLYTPSNELILESWFFRGAKPVIPYEINGQ